MACFLCRLTPPRRSFPADMTAAEAAAMQAHVGYWSGLAAQGQAVVFGPMADPGGMWGGAIVEAGEAAAVDRLQADDPVMAAAIGMRWEVLAMPNAIVGARRSGGVEGAA